MLLAHEAATTPAARPKRRLVINQPIIVGCSAAAIFLALSLLHNGFLSPNNLINLVHDVAVLGILSVGTATVVIGGGIDLSMVSIIGVSIALLFVLVADGVPTPLAVALTAGAALLSGAANGALIAYVEIPPLFTALTAGTIGLGLGQYFVFSDASIIMPKTIGWLSELGAGKIAGVPISLFLFLIIAAGAHFLLKYTARATEEEFSGFVRARFERAALPKSDMIVSEIPLSGAGKISTLLLRRKTVASTFQEELDRLGPGDRVHAAVVDDRLAGEVVMLTCSAPCAVGEDRRAEAAAALNGYGTEFRWANDVAVGDEAERGDGRQVEAGCL
jgi:hypothetical protein